MCGLQSAQLERNMWREANRVGRLFVALLFGGSGIRTTVFERHLIVSEDINGTGAHEATVKIKPQFHMSDYGTPAPLTVVHKYNDLNPNTHVLTWGDGYPLRWDLEDPDIGSVQTEPDALLYGDWWMVTFQIKPEGSWRIGAGGTIEFMKGPPTKKGDHRCLYCEKEDGSCETWVTSPDNFWEQLVKDPMTYVKTGVAAANLAVSLASLGSATPLMVALGGTATEQVAGAMLSKSTQGYASCKLKAKDENNLVTVTVGSVVHSMPYNRETIRVPITIKRNGDKEPCEMIAVPMPCKPAIDIDTRGEKVDIALINEGAPQFRIKTAALVHRFNGLSPSVNIMEWKEVDVANKKKRTTATSTGFGFRSDWWILFWVEENDGCIVKTTVPSDWQHVENLIANSTATFGQVQVGRQAMRVLSETAGDSVGDLFGGVKHIAAHRSVDPRDHANSASEDVRKMLGLHFLNGITMSNETNGYIKCKITSETLTENVRSVIDVKVKISSPMVRQSVTFNVGNEVCEAPVFPLKCVDEARCSEREDCTKLNNAFFGKE